MQANWSLILNVLLLIGVIVAIWRLMKARKQSLSPKRYSPKLGVAEKNAASTPNYNDDIIAIRKVSETADADNTASINENLHLLTQTLENAPAPRLVLTEEEPAISVKPAPKPEPKIEQKPVAKDNNGSTLVLFLLAKDNRQFAGYELLQTLLAVGLRFGEGNLFHRHQFANGQGPVLFSLAAATATGVFDLQNIGAFSVRGLCLYMHASQNSGIDKERLAVMLETARQLSEELDAHLLDDRRKPLAADRVSFYYQALERNLATFGAAVASS